jgi:hypothetical protein
MLRYAAHCYVSGIRLSTAPLQAVGMKGRNEEALTASIDLLPRLLHLMTFEDRDGEHDMAQLVACVCWCLKPDVSGSDGARILLLRPCLCCAHTVGVEASLFFCAGMLLQLS